MLLQQAYMPVISPVALGEDGQSYTIPADQVAAEVAVAVGATKLIYVTDEPGIVLNGELVAQLTAHELQERLQAGALSNGARSRARSILRALAGGVEQVHVLDGRVPHTTIAELFTDRGVGTLVSRG
jgi:acetylglutamate kinase